MGIAQTVGIDLAAQPERTAVCRITWRDGRAEVEVPDQAWSDDALTALICASEKVGIDCPLGWPIDFVDVVQRHAARQALPPTERTTLVYRITDREIHQRGRWPLSVSTDRIGVVALRCAYLLNAVSERTGHPIDRTGSGAVVEVYPAAALRAWQLLPSRSYKRTGRTDTLGQMLDGIVGQLDIGFVGTAEQQLRGNHDVFDAFVCAVVTRAVTCGHTVGPEPGQLAAAQAEGWIHVPRADRSLRESVGQG